MKNKSRILKLLYLLKSIEFCSLLLFALLPADYFLKLMKFISQTSFPVEWVNNPFFIYFYRTFLIVYFTVGIVFFIFYKNTEEIIQKYHKMAGSFLMVYGMGCLYIGLLVGMSNFIVVYDLISNAGSGTLIVLLHKNIV